MSSHIKSAACSGVLALACLTACDLVPADRCNTESGFCEAAGLRIVKPTQGGTVGELVEVVVATTFSSAQAEPEGPIRVMAGSDQVSLSRQHDGTWSGVWQPQTPGPRELVALEGNSGIASEAISVTVDLQDPVFTFVVPTPLRTTDAGFTDDDGVHWKRDERVPLVVEGPSDVDPATVQYSLQAVIGSTPGPQLPLRAVSGQIEGGKYVATIDVDLSEPRFDGFRGAINVQITGRDRAQNQGSATQAIPVSRFKWSRQLPLVGTQVDPAISHDGALWTGVRDGGVGALYRLEQDGRMDAFIAPGLVGGLLVAQLPGGSDAGVYFTASLDAGAGVPDAGYLQVANEFGALSHVCGPYANGMAPQLALLYGLYSVDNGQTTVVAASMADNGYLLGATVGASSLVCRTQPLGAVPAAAAWGAYKAAVYVPQSTGTTRLDFGAANWLSQPGFANTQFVSISPDPAGIWAAGAAAAEGGAFLYSEQGSLLASVESGTISAGPLAINPSGTLYFGDGAGQLVQADEGGIIKAVALDVATSPVIGQDFTVYAAAKSGRLVAYDRELNELWAMPDAGVAPRNMLLDCRRDADGVPVPARSGVLYVPVGAGIIAVVADSRGLANSPWPRHLHDNANTASRSTPIFICPAP